MSSAKPDLVAPVSPRVEALRQDYERACAELAQGLHVLAQPLTILRSSIAMLEMTIDSAADRTRYLELASRQTERACQIFSLVQGLLAAHRKPPALEPVELARLVSQIVEDCFPMFRAKNVALSIGTAESQAEVLADPARTEQAVRALLETAAAVSNQGDVVEVGTSRVSGAVEFAVQSTCALNNNFSSLERLSLSAAQANILSQHGKYSLVPEPMRIAFELPSAHID